MLQPRESILAIISILVCPILPPQVTFIGDENRFRESSAGVSFFHPSTLETGVFTVLEVFGLVEELVVEDDPEFALMDRARSARSSNELRLGLLYKLGSRVRRQLGRKVLELGGNAVLAFKQHLDVEGDSGLVARAYGTAALVVPTPELEKGLRDAHQQVAATLMQSLRRDRGRMLELRRRDANQRRLEEEEEEEAEMRRRQRRVDDEGEEEPGQREQEHRAHVGVDDDERGGNRGKLRRQGSNSSHSSSGSGRVLPSSLSEGNLTSLASSPTNRDALLPNNQAPGAAAAATTDEHASHRGHRSRERRYRAARTSTGRKRRDYRRPNAHSDSNHAAPGDHSAQLESSLSAWVASGFGLEDWHLPSDGDGRVGFELLAWRASKAVIEASTAGQSARSTEFGDFSDDAADRGSDASGNGNDHGDGNSRGGGGAGGKHGGGGGGQRGEGSGGSNGGEDGPSNDVASGATQAPNAAIQHLVRR